MTACPFAKLDSLFKRLRKNHRRHLADEERDVVDAYFNKYEDGRAMIVNRALMARRRCPSSIQKFVHVLDDALSSAPSLSNIITSCDLVLYRGLRLSGARELSSTWNVGSSRTFRGYVSCSPISVRALMYVDRDGCLLRMAINACSSLRFVYNPREEEVLLPRDTTWRLMGKTRMSKAVMLREGLLRPHPRDPDTSYEAVAPDRIWVLDIVPS